MILRISTKIIISCVLISYGPTESDINIIGI